MVVAVVSLWVGMDKESSEPPVPAQAALPSRRQQLRPALRAGGGSYYRTGLGEAVGLGRLFVLAGGARTSLLTVNQPIQGLAFSGEPGLPWGRVRPGAHRSGWPDLFLTVEACVNIEALISTSEAFLKRDWCFGPPKGLVGEIASSVFGLLLISWALWATMSRGLQSPVH